MPPGNGAAWAAERDGVTELPVRLLQPIPWRVSADGREVEVWSQSAATWKRDRIGVAALFEGLERGLALPDIVAAMQARDPTMTRGQARGMTIVLVMALWRKGNVEIVLPALPSVLGDRYERVRELGRGGMGVAWLCRDLQGQGRSVVVKHAWNFAAPLALCDRAIRDEAEVLTALDHPAIVRLLGRFELDGRFHLVREFLDGPSLGKAASRTGLPPARRRDVARQVAEAIAHVHARGFLFLDVQPDNFFLLEDGAVKAGDTGLCRRLEGGRVALPRPVGARGFIAPEVMRPQPEATVRSDVGGFGRLYYALIAGRRPSQRADAAALAAQVREAGAPEDEAAFVGRCCADDPAARPADMADVARQLAALAPA